MDLLTVESVIALEDHTNLHYTIYELQIEK